MYAEPVEVSQNYIALPNQKMWRKFMMSEVQQDFCAASQSFKGALFHVWLPKILETFSKAFNLI